MMLQIESLNL